MFRHGKQWLDYSVLFYSVCQRQNINAMVNIKEKTRQAFLKFSSSFRYLFTLQDICTELMVWVLRQLVIQIAMRYIKHRT